MKRILTILAALLIGAATFSAHAQLKITGQSDAAEKVVTLNPMVSWIYLMNDKYYVVITTTNQFDSLMWLDLGGSKDEAVKTMMALLDTLHEVKKGDHITIESQGDKFMLTRESMIGIPQWIISAVETRNVYAGYGSLDETALKKGIKFLKK